MSEDKNTEITIMNESEKKQMKVVKKISIVFLAVLIIGGAFYAGVEYGRGLPASHKAYRDSEVYATVDDVNITGKDIKSVMEPIFYLNGLQKLTDSEIASYEATMLEYLVNIEVLYKEAEANGIEVSDESVQNNYDSTMDNVNSQYNLTEAEYLEKFNLTQEQLKERIRKELMGATYLEEYSDVDEDEAKNYFEKNKDDYKQVKVAHILISNYDSDDKMVSDEQKKENEKTAEEVLHLALSGDDFSSLVQEFSDDSSVSSNGELDYFTKDEMVASFSNAAFSLEDGEIYPEVVETSSGYHIIKKLAEKEQSFDDIKDDLIATLKSNKQSTLMQDLYSKYNVSTEN